MADNLNREFIVDLTHRDRLRFRIKTSNDLDRRPTYAIQLECWFNEIGRWRQVIRADDFDGAPHLDIHSPNGTTSDIPQPNTFVMWLGLLSDLGEPTLTELFFTSPACPSVEGSQKLILFQLVGGG